MSLITDRPRPPAPAADRAREGDPFVAGALLTTAALLVTYQVIALHLIPPLAIFAVLTGVLGAATLRRRSRWLLALDGLVAVTYLAGSAPFIVVHLAHPESPVSFLAELFLVLALVTILVGVALRWRHPGARAADRAGTGGDPGEHVGESGDTTRRRVLTAVGSVALLATVGSLLAAAGLDADARQEGDVPVVSERSTFPAEVVAGVGDVLWVDNRDPFHHTFVIDGTEVHEVLAAGSSVRVPLDLAPGTYRFWCDVPGHDAMEGALLVR